MLSRRVNNLLDFSTLETRPRAMNSPDFKNAKHDCGPFKKWFGGHLAASSVFPYCMEHVIDLALEPTGRQLLSMLSVFGRTVLWRWEARNLEI